MNIDGYAFVIGGGGGIGRATSIAFAKEGARGLLVADIDLEAATKTAADSRSSATNPDFRAEAIKLDVTAPDSVQQAITYMVETFGRIDYCVNGAGMTGKGLAHIADTSFDVFQTVLDVNVNGLFHVLSAVSAVMKTQEPRAVDDTTPIRGVSRGTIVNLASVSSLRGLPHAVSYTTSKHAVVGLTRVAALDNVRYNIRVNCVCPSWVDTPMLSRITEATPGFDKVVLSQLPMGRLAAPEEIADAILFLSSPRSSWVNGSSMVVDGAMTIRP
ncbi:hypothetical protein ONZ43_g5468 [Nemania bipapillata]|uniref:Uncharacterized protein n=1 Tax=Nemania bipapillata TaxID=110536 RepID=A0ACC2IAD8_9PEZI|nr:hypothetical protein ONZ43_g5468 [Nemania bipapillata]